ncbi:MAG: PadR family transcriptional regulator, partial [Firmicutes bacterium]|nr:PadR family transcriptional regulator [Bacillota bacterium]
MKGDYLRGNVETILLKCLQEHEELYGGEITDIIYTASEGTYKLKRPTMYSALKRLQDKKLVSVRREDSPIGGTRNYYALTKQGHEYLSGGKFDWVYSKLLIDNLILNKRSKSSGLGEDEEETTVTTTTTTITTTEEETPLIVPAPDQVYIEPLAPIEPPIINEPQLLPIAEVEADKVEEFTSVLAGHV